MEAGGAGGQRGRGESDPVVVSGERHLLGSDLSTDVDTLRRMFDSSSTRRGVITAGYDPIGAHGRADLPSAASPSSCRWTNALVVAPYTVDGQVVGTLGVVGPTAQAYERVIPIVDIRAQLLSSAFVAELKLRVSRDRYGGPSCIGRKQISRLRFGGGRGSGRLSTARTLPDLRRREGGRKWRGSCAKVVATYLA